MKTYRHLYPQVYAWENLELAYCKARKGKRARKPAATFEFDRERNLTELQEGLRHKTYRPGLYDSFVTRSCVLANRGSQPPSPGASHARALSLHSQIVPKRGLRSVQYKGSQSPSPGASYARVLSPYGQIVPRQGSHPCSLMASYVRAPLPYI